MLVTINTLLVLINFYFVVDLGPTHAVFNVLACIICLSVILGLVMLNRYKKKGIKYDSKAHAQHAGQRV